MSRVIVAAVAVSFAVLALPELAAQPTLDQLEQGGPPAQPSNPATPADAAKEPGYLGLIGDDRQEQGRGVRVLEAVPGQGAQQGGIAVGDLITAIDGRPVRTLDELASAIASKPPGGQVRIDLERQGATRQVLVTLGRRARGIPPAQLAPPGTALPPPQDPAARPRTRLLGIRTVAVSEDMRQMYGLPSAEGALVSEVIVGSPAHVAGIPLDSVIVAVNSTRVATPDELAQAVAGVGPGKEVELNYYSRGELKRQKVRLADSQDADQFAARPVRPPAPLVRDAAKDVERIEQLERRVQQLEQRIAELLERLQQPSPPN